MIAVQKPRHHRTLSVSEREPGAPKASVHSDKVAFLIQIPTRKPSIVRLLQLVH